MLPLEQWAHWLYNTNDNNAGYIDAPWRTRIFTNCTNLNQHSTHLQQRQCTETQTGNWPWACLSFALSRRPKANWPRLVSSSFTLNLSYLHSLNSWMPFRFTEITCTSTVFFFSINCEIVFFKNRICGPECHSLVRTLSSGIFTCTTAASTKGEAPCIFRGLPSDLLTNACWTWAHNDCIGERFFGHYAALAR